MKTLFLLFNHQLTPEQEADARNAWGVTHFAYLPEHLQKMWSQVPAGEINLRIYLEPIAIWIAQAKSEDLVLIQGDYGAAVYMVAYCLKGGYGLPVYSTTERHTEEVRLPDGRIEVKRSIRHCLFRKYDALTRPSLV
jgi:hypothetical protein